MQKNPCLHNGATQIFLNLIRDFSLFYNLLTFFIIKSPQLAKYARPAAQSELRSLAQGLLRPLCACCSRASLENPVHGMGDLVYGDNDYDVRGQEKGGYFGRWGIIGSRGDGTG